MPRMQICVMVAGYVVLLVGENGRCCPIAWKSNKVKRVVGSTLAAETLACVNACDDALYIKEILREIISPTCSFQIQCYVDHRSLVENLKSTKLVQEKILRINLASLKEMIERSEIRSIEWVDTKSQLADGLTKRGVNCRKLRDLFSSGKLDL